MMNPEKLSEAQFVPALIKHLNGRLRDVFSERELSKALIETGIRYDQDLRPTSCPDDPQAMLEAYIEGLMRAKGPLWPALIEGEICVFLSSRRIPLPALFRRKNKELSRALDGQVSEAQRLREENFDLQQSMVQARDDQIKDPITGFYNETFFKEYLEAMGPRIMESGSLQDTTLFIRLDDIQRLNQRFGTEAGNAALKSLGRLLLHNERGNTAFFRMNGPLFTCYLSGCDKVAAYSFARNLQQEVADSNEFIQSIQVSIAIIDLAEMDSALLAPDLIFANVMKLAKERIALLNKIGPGSICQDSKITLRRSSGTVLLIEENVFEADLLRRLLEQRGFETHSVTNGGQAVIEADLHRPDVIVSEIFVSQMDGFQIRQRLLESQDLRNIPFVLVSRGKESATVEKALSLGVRHFFKKPVMPEELGGTIAALVRDSATERRP